MTTTTERPAPTRIRIALANVKEGMTFTLGDMECTVTKMTETGMTVDRVDPEHPGRAVPDWFSTERMFNHTMAGKPRLDYPEGARMVDVHVTGGWPDFFRLTKQLDQGIHYWARLGAALDVIENAPADTYAKVKQVLDAYAVDIERADGTRMPVSTNPGRAFFAGSGGSRSLASALRVAGWRTVWSEASYHYIAENPADKGNVLHYIEGDVELMTRPAAEKWVAEYASHVNDWRGVGQHRNPGGVDVKGTVWDQGHATTIPTEVD